MSPCFTQAVRLNIVLFVPFVGLSKDERMIILSKTAIIKLVRITTIETRALSSIIPKIEKVPAREMVPIIILEWLGNDKSN